MSTQPRRDPQAASPAATPADNIAGSARSAPDAGPATIGYLACSAFSGSTLVSFLLNLHPDVVSAGHSTGWIELTPEFPCSCGEAVSACPFFGAVGAAFADAGIPFRLEGFFPNAYRLSRVERVNQLLFDTLPKLSATRLERLRDRLVRSLPGLRQRVSRIDRSNLVFFDTACRYAGASVYFDNSHSPLRFRQLSYIPSLNVVPFHLVRDARGVVLSDMEVYAWSLEFSARHWIRSQEHIVRVLRDSDAGRSHADYADLVIAYEDLCDRPLETLNRVHRRLGVGELDSLRDFKSVEHHILGNRMRFGEGTIRKSERWRSGLTGAQQQRVVDIASAHAARSPFSTDLERVLSASLR